MITPLQIIERIDNYTLANEEQGPRNYLGASEIGEKCIRRLWYSFRWCGKEKFSARMIRLFNRGHLEEKVFAANLRGAGFTVEASHEYPKEEQELFQFSDCSGHFKGTCDSVVLQPIEFDPEQTTWMLGELKTWKVETVDTPSPAYNALTKRGIVEVNYKHYAQMMTYAGQLKLDWVLYGAECKNDDRLHFEILPFNPDVFQTCCSKAAIVINSDRPPERISNNPDTFACRYCHFKQICHENALPDPHCRNCSHSAPAAGGTWECLKGEAFGTLCQHYQPITRG